MQQKNPSIRTVQVSWDEHQEQKEQESEVNQSLEWYRGQSCESGGKMTQSLWRSRDDHVWTPDIERKAVILKLFWRPQDLEMLEFWITCSGKLHSGNKATRRARILPLWTKQKGFGDLKNTLTTDMEMQNLEIAQLAWDIFRSSISLCCLYEWWSIYCEFGGIWCAFMFLNIITVTWQD